MLFRLLTLFALFFGIAPLVLCARFPCPPEMAKVCEEFCTAPEKKCRVTETSVDCAIMPPNEATTNCSDGDFTSCSSLHKLLRCQDKVSFCNCEGKTNGKEICQTVGPTKPKC